MGPIIQTRGASLEAVAASEIIRNAARIDEWFDRMRSRTDGPVYASCDIRNARFKVAAVDTNLFPGGFNNLCAAQQARASEVFRRYFNLHAPGAAKAALLTESHTRNPHYLSNVRALERMLRAAGYEVRLGMLDRPDRDGELHTHEGERLVVDSFQRDGDRLTLPGFRPDFLLINNDFSAGLPEMFNGVRTPMFPSPRAGWHLRRKSSHFEEVRRLTVDLCERIGLDPWLLTALFDSSGPVDFKTREGVEDVAERTDRLLRSVREKYAEYGIEGEPFVFIKDDSGTYGMSVVPVHSARDVLEMNKRDRTRMQRGKNGSKVRRVIIQEGIPSVDRYRDAVGETVMCLVGGELIGAFSRLNPRKGERENLNAVGMQFRSLCPEEDPAFSTREGAASVKTSPQARLAARLGSLAAGFEIKALEAAE